MEDSTPKRDKSQELDAALGRLRIKCCRAHPRKEVKGFCEDCGVFFCGECFDKHMDHDAGTLKKFCAKRKKDILN